WSGQEARPPAQLGRDTVAVDSEAGMTMSAGPDGAGQRPTRFYLTVAVIAAAVLAAPVGLFAVGLSEHGSFGAAVAVVAVVGGLVVVSYLLRHQRRLRDGAAPSSDPAGAGEGYDPMSKFR